MNEYILERLIPAKCHWGKSSNPKALNDRSFLSLNFYGLENRYDISQHLSYAIPSIRNLGCYIDNSRGEYLDLFSITPPPCLLLCMILNEYLFDNLVPTEYYINHFRAINCAHGRLFMAVLVHISR